MNQLEFSRASPTLDLFLAKDGVRRSVELFEIQEPPDAVLLRKPRSQTFAMLFQAPFQIVRDPNIENTRLAADDVTRKGSALAFPYFSWARLVPQNRRAYSIAGHRSITTIRPA